MSTAVALAPKTMPIFPGLIGKVALVTGASRGIGAETARYLAANLVRVVVNGRDRAAVNHVVEQIESTGGCALGSPQIAHGQRKSRPCVAPWQSASAVSIC